MIQDESLRRVRLFPQRRAVEQRVFGRVPPLVPALRVVELRGRGVDRGGVVLLLVLSVIELELANSRRIVEKREILMLPEIAIHDYLTRAVPFNDKARAPSSKHSRANDLRFAPSSGAIHTSSCPSRYRGFASRKNRTCSRRRRCSPISAMSSRRRPGADANATTPRAAS